MKLRSIQIFPILLCLSGLVAWAQDVKYNYDSAVNFSKYHTYQWLSFATAHPDQLIDREIRRAVEVQLAAKGLIPTASNPEIQVGYQIAVDKEREWNAWGTGLGPRFWGGGFGTAASSTINIGTLVIDFFDPATKSLVWRGLGTKTIEPSGNAEKNMERLQKA